MFAWDRVLEDTSETGTVTARYTLTDASYFAPLLHVWQVSGSLSRFPLYDLTGTVRGTADASGTAQDTNYLDAFGVSRQAGSGTPISRFTYDGAWGYATEFHAFLIQDPTPFLRSPSGSMPVIGLLQPST